MGRPDPGREFGSLASTEFRDKQDTNPIDVRVEISDPFDGGFRILSPDLVEIWVSWNYVSTHQEPPVSAYQ